ncbi:putative leucine-rich repeat protein [Blattamonas nauphoetae]|uniref:Leucine-rich repeat protein n=1 Tax=Blattamonas nauphoetae TaxID=2049346 RepID=A0ABQ9YDQ2_9EUKA|nr:putative leucine-rich repeat protein [Blattamonas nauphoetae]
MLSSPYLRDISVIDDRLIGKDMLEILEKCVSLASPDTLQTLSINLHSDPESIRDVVARDTKGTLSPTSQLSLDVQITIGFVVQQDQHLRTLCFLNPSRTALDPQSTPLISTQHQHPLSCSSFPFTHPKSKCPLLDHPTQPVLDLSRNNISSIDKPLVVPTLTSLSLALNRLTSFVLPNGSHLPRLPILDLRMNYLDTLDEQTFESLPTMKSFYLTSNKLESLPDRLGDILPNLSTVWVGQNRLKTLSSSYSDLTNPIDIFSGTNELVSCPDFWMRSTGDLRVNIPNNRLRTLPRLSCEVVVFSADSNQISEIGEGVERLVCDYSSDVFAWPSRMKSVSLKDNLISSLPKTLFTPTLTCLLLAHNLLTDLADGLFTLPNLQTLDVSFNSLAIIPPSISQLRSLVKVTFGLKKIKEVPNELFRFPTLIFLILSHNKLTSLPTDPAMSPNCELSLGFVDPLNNSMIYEKTGTGTHARAVVCPLERLLLASNQLTSVPPLVSQFRKLHTLSLAGNGISELLRHFFHLLPNLSRHRLSFRELTHLPKSIGSGNTKRISLDVSFNKMTYLTHFYFFISQTVLSNHPTLNHFSHISSPKVILSSIQYESRNLGIKDNFVELQGTANTVLVFDSKHHSSNGVETLLRISNSTVKMDKLRLDGCVNQPNPLHRSYSSVSDVGAISLFSVCSSSVRLSNSEMLVGSGQSPFVVTGQQDAENSEQTMICVVASVLLSSNSIIGATASILADSGNLGLSVSVMSCDMDSTRIGSWNGLLVDQRKPGASTSNVVDIETFLSDCRLENVTGAASNRHADGGCKLWRQRLVSNSITKSSSVLSGTVIRDFNDGGDLLCANTTFASCSTSAAPPITRHSIEATLLQPYLLPNLRQHTSKDGKYEWTDSAFQNTPGFNFYAYAKDTYYYDQGLNFIFGTAADTITFSSCSFTDIDGEDPSDSFRQHALSTICLQCPSSLFIDRCSFNNCSSEGLAGAVTVDVEFEFLKASITSSSFDDCIAKVVVDTTTQSSVLFHRSLGILTIDSSNLTYNGQTAQQQIIRSQGLLVANSQFIFNGSIVTHPVDVFASPYHFRFTRFTSDTQAEYDVYASFKGGVHDEWTFFGCVSNSVEAHDLQIYGLTVPSIDLEPEQIIVESGSLQTILSNNPTVNTVFIGAGDFGTFSVEGRLFSLYGWTPKAASNPSSTPITKLAATVGSDPYADFRLNNIQVAPCSSSSTIITSAGYCSLIRVVVDSVKEQAAPLFVMSGSSACLYVHNCKITNIVNSKANIVTVTEGAQISFEFSVFANITTTECVVSAVGSLYVTFDTSFLNHIHRTEGSGPAAIEVSSASSLTLSEVVLHHCVSDKGNAGAIHISTSSPAFISLSLTFLSNSGANTSPKDIFIEGLDEQECRDLLMQGIHVGQGPHFGWSKEGHMGVGSIQIPSVVFHVSTLTRFQTPTAGETHYVHPSDFQIRDVLVNLMPQEQGFEIDPIDLKIFDLNKLSGFSILRSVDPNFCRIDLKMQSLGMSNGRTKRRSTRTTDSGHVQVKKKCFMWPKST